MTRVQLTVKNPHQPAKKFAGNFLIDSGATYTVVPKNILQDLGIKPERDEIISLADGTIIRRKLGSALFEYKGIKSVAPVLFGEKDDSALLGVITLEVMGLVLDPLKRKLYKAVVRM